MKKYPYRCFHQLRVEHVVVSTTEDEYILVMVDYVHALVYTHHQEHSIVMYFMPDALHVTFGHSIIVTMVVYVGEETSGSCVHEAEWVHFSMRAKWLEMQLGFSYGYGEVT